MNNDFISTHSKPIPGLALKKQPAGEEDSFHIEFSITQ